jgi:hypothetical protein
MTKEIDMATKKKAAAGTKKSNGKAQPVVVRAYSGVFFGYLLGKSGATVELRDARQIWSWDSAGLAEKVNTCGDIAVRGLGSGSKVSSPCSSVSVEQVGAVFVATPVAVQIIEAQKWASK